MRLFKSFAVRTAIFASCNQIVLVLVLVLDCLDQDYEDEDERFRRPATILTDTRKCAALVKLIVGSSV